MIDPNLIRTNPELVKKNTSERGNNPEVVDKWIELDKVRSRLIQEAEKKRKERNDLNQGLSGKPDEQTIQRMKTLRSEIEEVEEKLEEIEEKWQQAINQIPNIHLSDVPVGQSEDENVVIEHVGEKPVFDF